LAIYLKNISPHYYYGKKCKTAKNQKKYFSIYYHERKCDFGKVSDKFFKNIFGCRRAADEGLGLPKKRGFGKRPGKRKPPRSDGGFYGMGNATFSKWLPFAYACGLLFHVGYPL